MFPERISKEEVNELPLWQWEGTIEVVEDAAGVAEAFTEIFKHRVAGWDTETKPAFRRGQNHQTALLQIAVDEVVFLFQLHKTGFTREMATFFEDGTIIKPGVAILDDVRGLQKYHQFRPAGVVELSDVATDLGITTVGARNLTAIFLQRRISKSQQTSNWENDPLTEAQQRYAATDARICREMFIYLESGGHLEGLTWQRQW